MALFSRWGSAPAGSVRRTTAISEVMKMPLWARMIGRARRSQLRDLSGSMPAGGASLRATSAMGTNSVPVSGGSGGGAEGRASSPAPPGPGVGHEGGPPGGEPAERRLRGVRVVQGIGRRRAGAPRRRRRLRRAPGGPRRSARGRPAGGRRPPGGAPTRPRATRPSTTAVTVGGRTASRSARWEEAADDSSSRLQDPVLRDRQVDGGEPDLDLLGQPGGGAAEGTTTAVDGHDGRVGSGVT